MSGRAALPLHNGSAVPLSAIPAWTMDAVRKHLVASITDGGRIAALFARPLGGESFRLFAVVAHSAAGTLSVCTTDVGKSYPALTPDCPQAHWFEREIAEQWGIEPQGHPWLKPIRCAPRHQVDARGTWIRQASASAPGVIDFFVVQGDEVHEVAVGPVHAGIIEPGHFRFQCHGEHVFHLEIALGYQHRGIEPALVGGPDKRTMHRIEALAGDTSAGHGVAYCETVEALAGTQPSARAQVLRGVALELERLANHTGDLGALAGDVAYLPTAAYCGRIRGEFLNLSAALCGSRFGRGLLLPGGVRFEVDAPSAVHMCERLDRAYADVDEAVGLLWDTPSVGARFERTGAVSREDAERLGLVGVAARACGLERVVRHEFPSGIYRFVHIPACTWDTGDVFARAYVRWLEIQRSAAFVREQLSALPGGALRAPVGRLAPEHLAVVLVEGWRGEICHVAITDDDGRFAQYKIVDASFHNWMGLALALRQQEISDFPLCNKSFNLSYCGHDL